MCRLLILILIHVVGSHRNKLRHAFHLRRVLQITKVIFRRCVSGACVTFAELQVVHVFERRKLCRIAGCHADLLLENSILTNTASSRPNLLLRDESLLLVLMSLNIDRWNGTSERVHLNEVYGLLSLADILWWWKLR